MDTTIDDNPSASRFEIRVDGELAGFVEYRRADAVLSLTHTEIGADFEGRGLGSTLVRGTLDIVRDRQLAVLPFCPFVRDYLQRHHEYLDLVPADQRTRFQLG